MKKRSVMKAAVLAAWMTLVMNGSNAMFPSYGADRPSKIYINGIETEVPETWTSETIRKLIRESEKAGTSSGSQGKTADIEVKDTPKAGAGVGWIASGDSWIYYKEDGTALTDSVTPDGYYVDVEGRWRPRTMTLMDESFALPDKFQGSGSVGSLMTNLEPLERLNKKIREMIGANRVFYVYDDSIQYFKGSTGKETYLMGLYKDPDGSAWQLKLSVKLNKSMTRSAEETCDYMVFRFLLGQVTHVPERVSEAIYESWQGSNSYGITTTTPVIVGDTAITYSVENGAGVYKLSNAIRYR